MTSKRKLARARLKRIRELKGKSAVAVRSSSAKSKKDAVRVDAPDEAMTAEHTDRNKERQRAIETLERDVAELSRLSDPTDQTASD
ncbi:MAG: hypothetical protein WAL86_11965, partial [Candidatus Acidiferrales bacterium]